MMKEELQTLTRRKNKCRRQIHLFWKISWKVSSESLAMKWSSRNPQIGSFLKMINTVLQTSIKMRLLRCWVLSHIKMWTLKGTSLLCNSCFSLPVSSLCSLFLIRYLQSWNSLTNYRNNPMRHSKWVIWHSCAFCTVQ